MQSCPKCGAEVDDLVTVCPNCGSQIESKPSSLDAPSDTDKTPRRQRKKPTPSLPPSKVDVTKRPTMALIAAILLIIGGVILVLYSTPFLIGAYQGGVNITYTLSTNTTTLANSTTAGTSYTTTTLTTVTNSTTATQTYTLYSENIASSFLAFFGISYVVAGIASLVAGFGFLNRMKIAWRLALVISVFGIVQILLLSDPYNLFIGVAVLYLQTRPPVKAWLRGPSPKIDDSTKK